MSGDRILDTVQEAILRSLHIPASATMHPGTQASLMRRVDRIESLNLGPPEPVTIFGLRLVTSRDIPPGEVRICNGDGQVIEVVNIGDDKEADKTA